MFEDSIKYLDKFQEELFPQEEILLDVHNKLYIYIYIYYIKYHEENMNLHEESYCSLFNNIGNSNLCEHIHSIRDNEVSYSECLNISEGILKKGNNAAIVKYLNNINIYVYK